MKFSIIVPVYNVSEYISKCLNSIFSSTYKSYEVIIVNDGSTDDSEKIIKEAIKDKENVKYIKQSNKGLSGARNTGVKHAKGEYLLFVDSDDYIDKNLLKELSTKNSDVIRFQAAIDNGKDIINKEEIEMDTCSGIDAFKKISSFYYVENAWLYAYKREFYLKNKFVFKEGVYHEDFGLIPKIIYKACSVDIINYIGYYYVQRDNSIMSSTDYNKTVKKCMDMLDLCVENINYFKNKKDSKYFLSYISNCTIVKIRELHGVEYKEYKRKLKDKNVFSYVLNNSLGRVLKNIIMRLNLKLYLKIIK